MLVLREGWRDPGTDSRRGSEFKLSGWGGLKIVEGPLLGRHHNHQHQSDDRVHAERKKWAMLF